ncbi:MAG: XdhC family protein [Candidatus Woesearchaeota archaeon]
MGKRKIYDKIANIDLIKEKLILATITDSSKRYDQNLFSEKILFSNKSNAICSFEDKKLLEKIVDNLEMNNKFFNKNKAEKITLELNEGKIELFLDPIYDDPRVIIFGSGHVSQPLAKIAKVAGFTVNVVDDRKGLLNKGYFPTADKLILSEYSDYLDEMKIRNDDYLVIVTRGHQHDYEVLKGVIDSPAKYIGMIGSKTKVKLTFDELREKDNVNEKLLNKVDAPIGIHLGSETPAEIAVSIMAKIISVRRGRNEA